MASTFPCEEFKIRMYLLSGYGNLVPKTALGKILSIFYALVGIPIMLLYCATIGSILATSFKYLYTKLCR